MMRLLAILSSTFVLLTAPAFAQSGNPAGMTLGTGPQQPNNPDRIFVRTAAVGGMAEVELGKLAQQEAENGTVQDFAMRMVEDHGKANEQLAGLAKQDGVAVPDGLDQKHQAMLDRLQEMSGAAFDRAYIAGQVADHQNTAQLLEYEIGSGQDVELKSFASEILPIVLEHLQMAQDIQAKLNGSAP
jgi:putative membrane protein